MKIIGRALGSQEGHERVRDSSGEVVPGALDQLRPGADQLLRQL